MKKILFSGLTKHYTELQTCVRGEYAVAIWGGEPQIGKRLIDSENGLCNVPFVKEEYDMIVLDLKHFEMFNPFQQICLLKKDEKTSAWAKEMKFILIVEDYERGKVQENFNQFKSSLSTDANVQPSDYFTIASINDISKTIFFNFKNQ